MIKSIPIIGLLLISTLVSANYNIDSAGVKTYSTSDGQVITKVGVVATFRLGLQAGTPEPKLHGETSNGQYLSVTASNDRPDFKQVSFVEDLQNSKSRWIEIRLYDDETYSKLLDARQKGAREGSFAPLKTISVSHYGVEGGPMLKMETVATLSLIGMFVFAQSIRNKIVN